MSKGGSQTTSQELPDWLRDDVERNLDRADEISQIGYTPYRGPTVAALDPMQIAAMKNNRAAARSAGFDVGGPMQLPKVRDYGNGVQGYSAMPHYNNAMQLFQQHAPGQYDAIRAQFINPRTGAPPVSRAALTNDQRAELGIGQSDDMTDIEMDGTSGDGTSVDGTSNGTGFGYDGGVVGDVAFGDGTGEFGLPDPFGGPLGDAADAVGDATGLWKGRNYRRLKRGGMW